MVRVGGGWDTLENFLNKHDPCRCSGNSNDSIGKILSKHFFIFMCLFLYLSLINAFSYL